MLEIKLTEEEAYAYMTNQDVIAELQLKVIELEAALRDATDAEMPKEDTLLDSVAKMDYGASMAYIYTGEEETY